MGIADKLTGFIYRTVTGNRRKRYIYTPIVFVIFVTAVTAYIALGLYFDYLTGFPSVSVYPLNLFAGIPLLSAGILLSWYSIFTFIKSRGTPVPLSPPPKLITTGPYAYTRNPMLTGGFLQLFGFGIICDSFSLTLIFTPILILLSCLELKYIEEPELEKRLGDEYIQYKRRVPMFFPVKKKSKV